MYLFYRGIQSSSSMIIDFFGKKKQRSDLFEDLIPKFAQRQWKEEASTVLQKLD